MALPTILIDSATGSDSAASGAGPTSALTGSAGVSSGTTVTLDGSPDLSGVATDGSHVIFFNDTTAGRRNFSKITAVDNGAKTVTVAVAFTAGTKAWAIGGKRAALNSTSTKRLIDNNGVAGDAAGGWIIEMSSAHAEASIAAAIDVRTAGDATGGAFVIRGVSGAATLPKFTFSGNTNGFALRGAGVHLENFEIASSASKTGNAAAILPLVDGVSLKKMKVLTSGSNCWQYGVYNTTKPASTISECEFAGCNRGIGIDNSATSTSGFKFEANYIHDTVSHGMYILGNLFSCAIVDNVLDTCGVDGINFSNGRADTLGSGTIIARNTFYANVGDGLEIGDNQDCFIGLIIESNQFVSNGGYGINFTHASTTSLYLSFKRSILRNNNFYTNSSGKYNPSDVVSSDEQTVDPSFTDASNGDFRIGTATKALGYPTNKTGNYGNLQSYVDIGALQRQEAGGLPPRIMQITGAHRSEY